MAAGNIGFLSVTVKWPVRERAIALIPDSASSVKLTVSSGDIEVETKEVGRNVGEATVSVVVPIRAGTGYRLEVEAFSDRPPVLESAKAIATGAASGLEVRKGRRTLVPVSLTPVAERVPAILDIVPGNGGPGSSLTLNGQNFGKSTALGCLVDFPGAPGIPPLERSSDGELTVVVPDGALSGSVRVRVDGVPSTSTNRFLVIKKLSIESPDQVLTGSATAIGLKALDTADDTVETPTVKWSVDDAGVATIDAHGVLTPLGDEAASVSVKAASGKVSASRLVSILPRPTSLKVMPGSGTVNAMPSEGTPAPGLTTSLKLSAEVTYSDGATDSAVTWASADPTQATVTSDGLVTGAPDAPGGQVLITATSVRDGSVTRSATISVTIFGALDVIVD